MHFIKYYFFCFWAVFFIGAKTNAQNSGGIELANALQDHMVVQQNKPFKIWGKAPEGVSLSIKADWMQDPIIIRANNQGKFLGIIPVPQAKKGDYTSHQIVIYSGNKQITLSDLLIGDLWFCSGQSNMQFSVKQMIDSGSVIAAANNPHIRLLSVGLNFSKTPIDSFSGSWKKCSSESVRDFSAVGYSFGATLQKELDIPIGLIFSGIGASAVQAYVPLEVLGSDSLLNQVYLQPYLQNPKSRDSVNAAFSFEKVMRPFLLYNAMIHPFIRLSIKGFIWYQGESNDMQRSSYTQATISMISSWRHAFAQGELPFEFVQIAPYFHEKEDPALSYDAFFREAQQKILKLNNTTMVVTMDVGDARNLHPKNKWPVGVRLAKAALNRSYGMVDVPYLGPQYAYCEIKNREVVIHFDPKTVVNGLSTNDGKPPAFFYLAAKDSIFYPALARIENKTIVLQSSKVKKPIAVRYAFFNYPVTNLQNNDGFPAVPFRSDNWPEKQIKN